MFCDTNFTKCTAVYFYYIPPKHKKTETTLCFFVSIIDVLVAEAGIEPAIFRL